MKLIIINKTPWILAIFVLFQISCSEEWIKPQPLSFYAPENVFTNAEGFKALLVAMRKDLRKETHQTARCLIPNEMTISDLGATGQMNIKAAKNLILQFTPSGGELEDYSKAFTWPYESIKTCNLAISRIDDISWGDKDERNKILAEAYFFRSYWYYRLINTYGDVPFIGKEVTGARLDFYSHSRDAILDKLISDMEFAVQYLPIQAIAGAASKGAGNHLLTKLYLANCEFDKAIEAATRVIDGPYALMKNRFGSVANDKKRNLMWDLFRPENISIPVNAETILAVIDRYNAPAEARSTGCLKAYSYQMNWWDPHVLDSKGKPGTVAAKPLIDTILYSNGQQRPTPFYIYTLWNDGTYSWKNTPDLRRSNICWLDNGELKYNRPTSVDYGKPIDWRNYAAAMDTFQFFFASPYYKTFYPEQDPSKVNSQGGNGDGYIFRLAETYLLRAEAFFYEGDLSNAAKDINEVRERAHAIPVLPADVTIDYIMDESARELYSESPRHCELTRVAYIMAKTHLSGYSMENFSENNYFYDRVVSKNDFFRTNFYYYGNTFKIAPWHVLWPIPNSVIVANTMGIINQNQGYFGAENNVPPLEVIEE